MKRKQGIASSPKYDFAGGLVTAVSKTRLRPSQLIKASNINLLIDGEAEVRKGYAKVSTVAFGTVIDRLVHFKTDTYDKLIAYGGAYVKRLDVGSPDVWTTLSSTMPDTELYRSMVIAEGMLYIASHQGVKKYYPAKTELWNAGIAAPTAGLVATEGTAGNLLGTYRWYYTYYNSTTQEESNPNDISNELTVASKRVTLSGFVASTDPQVDKQRIYRNPTGVSTWYLVGEKANDANNYEDNVTDDHLTTEISYINYPPPNSTILLYHLNRMFYVDYSNPSRVCWSEPFKPGSVQPTSYQEIDGGDGGVIVALAAVYGNIIVFKNTGIFVLFFNPLSPTSSTYEPLAAKYSCVAPMSVQNIRENVIFLSSEGLKLITNGGTRIEDIEVMVEGEFGAKAVDPIANLLRSAHMDTVNKAVGFYYELRNQYLLSFPYYVNTSNDLTLVWNIDPNAFTLHEDFEMKAVAPYRSYDIDLIYGSHGNEYIYKHDEGTTDDGAAINWEIQTGWHPIDGTPDIKKVRWMIVSVLGSEGTTSHYEVLKDFEAGGSGLIKDLIRLDASYWGSAHWGNAHWGGAMDVIFKNKMRVRGRLFSLRFYGSSSAQVGVSGYQFLYQPKGFK